MTTARALPRAAKWYARRSYRVFALRARDKAPATAHGLHDATTDERKIATMWADPQHNVAIATGAESGLVVLDVDGDEGEASLAQFEAQHGLLPLTAAARTGRGRHLYFAHPGAPVRNSAGRLGPGLDVRADGGYVVAPPSVHPSGRVYAWLEGQRPDQTAPAPLPAWLAERLIDRPAPQFGAAAPRTSDVDAYARSALERECGAVATAQPGTRNARLNEAAYSLGQLVAGGALAEDVARSSLMAAAVGCGLGEHEAERTIASGLAAGAKQPRTVPAPKVRHDSDVGRVARLRSVTVEGGACEADAEWPEPIPLGSETEPTPFPLAALPMWLREWAEAEAEATQTPVDMAAMLALAVLATACQRCMVVRALDGWTEPLCIYVVTALPPGNRKSAVMHDVTEPLAAYERDEACRLARDIVDSEDTLAATRKRLERAIQSAASAQGPERLASDQNMHDARAELTAAERGVVRAPRLTCGDTTQEGLARLLAQHDECMSMIDAEGCGPLAIMAGRYTDGQSVIDLYLRAHAGDQYRCDRKGSDPIALTRPRLTMALTIQPDVLRQLGERREMRGLGLLARILWCVPESTVGRRCARPEPMPERVRDAYARHVRMLLELSRREDGDPHTLRLAAAADAELRTLIEHLEPQLGPGGQLQHMADAAAKLAGAVMRLAGLLHAAEHLIAPWATEVSVDTMRRAVMIGEYVLAHARTALGVMGADPVVAHARHVLEWLRARDIRTISCRDLYRGLRPRFTRSADLEPVLALLAEHGWIRIQAPQRTGQQGRSPSPVVELSPRALEDRTHGHNGQKGQNPLARSSTGDSVHSVLCVHSDGESLGQTEVAL